MQVSQLPEEKFIAFGTDRGNLHVYEVDNLMKGYKHSEFNTHEDRVNGIAFVERGDDFLIVTCSSDMHVAVHCLKESFLLHKLKFPEKLLQVVLKEDKILIRDIVDDHKETGSNLY